MRSDESEKSTKHTDSFQDRLADCWGNQPTNFKEMLHTPLCYVTSWQLSWIYAAT